MGGCHSSPLSPPPALAATLTDSALPLRTRKELGGTGRYRDHAPSALSLSSNVTSPSDSCTSLPAGEDWDEVLRHAVAGSVREEPSPAAGLAPEASTPGRQVLLTPPQVAMAALEDKTRASKRQKSIALGMPSSTPRKGSKEYNDVIAKATNMVRTKSLHALLEHRSENVDPVVNDLKVRLSGRRKGQETLNAFEFLARNQQVKEMRERNLAAADGSSAEAQGDASGLHMTYIMREFVVANAPRRLDVSWIPDLQRWDLEAAWEARNDDQLYERLQHVAFGQVFTELANSAEYNEFVKDQVAAGVLAFKLPPSSAGVTQRKAFLSRDSSGRSVNSSRRVSIMEEEV